VQDNEPAEKSKKFTVSSSHFIDCYDNLTLNYLGLNIKVAYQDSSGSLMEHSMSVLF